MSSLYGFTRFEAAPTSSDGDIEDIQLTVQGAPISRGTDRLPAIEQFREGLFIHKDEQAVNHWLQDPDVVNRQAGLLRGYDHGALGFLEELRTIWERPIRCSTVFRMP